MLQDMIFYKMKSINTDPMSFLLSFFVLMITKMGQRRGTYTFFFIV